MAMDTVISDIRAVEFTSSSDGGRPILPELLDKRPHRDEIGTVPLMGRTTPAAATLPSSTDRPLQSSRSAKRESEKRGLPGSYREERNPARHRELWQVILEAVGRLPRPKPDRGKDVVHQGLR